VDFAAAVESPEMKPSSRIIALSIAVAGFLVAGRTSESAPVVAVSPVAAVPGGDAAAGEESFTEHCSICHGASAKGFIGPSIAGVNWGTAGLQAIVRAGVGGYGGMPAFNAVAVTDKNIADIVVYLATLAPAMTPVAQHGAVASADTVHGQTIYAANCASCHGAKGAGGVGPELHGENTRKDTAGTISWIKNPILPMPTLYPKPLSEKDVHDVAAFVETL
jgi:cbb3-type cytochrome c oxidase subunit III